ncbi:MAG: ATP-binding cassette domain-containing protein [Naasia sp.]
MTTAEPLVELRSGRLDLGGRTLWRDLDLQLMPGELIAVLGPNGAGKSSLLRALLGQVPLTSGSASVAGREPGRGRERIGYVPQQKLFDRGVPLRARDLVGFGLDGDRFGPPVGRGARRPLIDRALDRAGALPFARRSVGDLSGGEQQRVRIASALVASPQVLICDEPLLSLDLAHQRVVLDSIDEYRRESGAGVLLVTHDINPILRTVDRVLYLAPGGHRIGPPDEVLTSEVLSGLYGVHVDVVEIHGRVIVVPADSVPHEPHEPAPVVDHA